MRFLTDLACVALAVALSLSPASAQALLDEDFAAGLPATWTLLGPALGPAWHDALPGECGAPSRWMAYDNGPVSCNAALPVASHFGILSSPTLVFSGTSDYFVSFVYRLDLDPTESVGVALGSSGGGPTTTVADLADLINDGAVHSFSVMLPNAALSGTQAELHIAVAGSAQPPSTQAGFQIDDIQVGPVPTSVGSVFCTSEPNSSGFPSVITATGSESVAANSLEFSAGPMAAGEPGLFYFGPDELQVPFGNGFRCVGGGPGEVFRVFPFVAADAAGSLRASLDLPSLPGTISPGSTWKFQAWFRDPAGGGQGFDLSDGISIDFTP